MHWPCICRFLFTWYFVGYHLLLLITPLAQTLVFVIHSGFKHIILFGEHSRSYSSSPLFLEQLLRALQTACVHDGHHLPFFVEKTF